MAVTMTDIGWIGCGKMGAAMADRLLSDGNALYVTTRSPSRASALIAKGATWCESATEIAERASVVITMVDTPASVRDLYLGEQGLATSPSPALVLIDMTTSSPQLAQEIHSVASIHGHSALDAPVSGGTRGAASGDLAIMVGGSRVAFEGVRRILDRLGTSVRHMGSSGAGQHTKLCNQILLAGNLGGACEAIRYAEIHGLDAGEVISLLRGGAAGSWVVEHLGPLIARRETEATFDLAHYLKDLSLARSSMANHDESLPILEAVHEMAAELVGQGLGRNGFQSLIRAYEHGEPNDARPEDQDLAGYRIGHNGRGGTQRAAIPGRLPVATRQQDRRRARMVPEQYLKTTKTFSEAQNQTLFKTLSAVRANPYRQYADFVGEIHELASGLPDIVGELRELAKTTDYGEQPALVLRNCPLDEDLPVFDFLDPVESKYALKKTFVSEGFLALFAEAAGTPSIGYRTINNGDVFHDVYLKESLSNTHSQKSLTSIGFHNDLPNNAVRPSWVNILCMRSSSENRVSTTFIRNQDLFAALDSETIKVLRKPVFFTGHEVISVHGGRSEKGIEIRPVIAEDPVFCFFEQRTQSISEEGKNAIATLERALHAQKQRLYLQPGDLIAINNNACIHGREVVEVNDLEAHKRRWLLKTWNVDSTESCSSKFCEERPYVVDE